jgi:tRNA pseudouridine55 synthase
MNAIDGLLVLDKPAGITSRRAVDAALRCFPRGTKIGHTGTLDPLATGVLVLCLGSATRLAEYVQRMRKTYRAGILLGARSDTDDADGTLTPTPGARPLDRAAVEAAVARYIGEIEQVPPAHSAVKVAGQRAYELARRGAAVDIGSRPVTIYAINVLKYDWPRLELEVQCGKGTYIRSLARDLGDQLGCGGLIATLRRTRVGPFRAEDALTLDTPADEARRRLLPPADALAELPHIEVNEREADQLRRGQVVARTTLPKGDVGVFGPGGRLVAVACSDMTRAVLRPTKVFNP